MRGPAAAGALSKREHVGHGDDGDDGDDWDSLSFLAQCSPVPQSKEGTFDLQRLVFY